MEVSSFVGGTGLSKTMTSAKHSTFTVYDDDDDDPTLVDSSGTEFGFCNVGAKIVPLSELGWDGVCRECVECDADARLDNRGSV